MKSLHKIHHERILNYAFRIKGISKINNELYNSASTILESQGVNALLNMLKMYPNKEELLESSHSIPVQTDGISQSNKHGLVNCLIDISDIINFFLAGHKTVSGIQRLVVATLSCIPKFERTSTILISAHNYEREGVMVVSWEIIDSIIRCISSDNNENELTSDIQTTILTHTYPLDSLEQNIESYTLLIMGAAWIVPSFPLAHRAIAQKYKLHVVSILYDLIPYTYPDFVSADASREFIFYINSLLSISDALISISKYVSDDLASHLDSLGRDLVVSPLNYYAELAREIPFKVLESSSATLKHIMREKLLSLGVEVDNFILNVGSVEIRKNHITLFVAWRQLLATLGNKCPQLIVVGRPGWKAESFFESLKSTNNLDGKLIILHGIDDALLSYLYETCKLTIYPSLEEGWGLPIGESLDAGKLCITSNRASMPEVGKELCYYVNPSNPLEIVKEIEKLLEYPELVKVAEKKILASLPLKSWGEYLSEIASLISTIKLKKINPISKMPAVNWFLSSGQTVAFYWHLGSDTYNLPVGLSGKNRSLQGLLPSRIVLCTKIDRFEPDGAWCKEPMFELSFYIDISEVKSTKFSVTLHYHLNESIDLLKTLEINAKCIIYFGNSTIDIDNRTLKKNNFELIAKNNSPNIYFISNDLVKFEFENVAIDHYKTLIDSLNIKKQRIFLPINIVVSWTPGFNFICSLGRELEPVKIKEILIDY